MQQYVMDDRVILSLQGLRSVKKHDHTHSKNVNIDDTYEIQWNYKGSDGFAKYSTMEKRDKIFNEIRTKILYKENPMKTLNPNPS